MYILIDCWSGERTSADHGAIEDDHLIRKLHLESVVIDVRLLEILLGQECVGEQEPHQSSELTCMRTFSQPSILKPHATSANMVVNVDPTSKFSRTQLEDVRSVRGVWFDVVDLQWKRNSLIRTASAGDL